MYYYLVMYINIPKHLHIRLIHFYHTIFATTYYFGIPSKAGVSKLDRE